MTIVSNLNEHRRAARCVGGLIDYGLAERLDRLAWRSIRRQQRLHMSAADAQKYHEHRIKMLEAWGQI